MFKRRLAYSVVVTMCLIAYNFVELLKRFIANLLKCKDCLKIKFECICFTMCSLMMSPQLM